MNTPTTPADPGHPHSKYGASSASRWRTCPGSVDAIEEARRMGEIPEEDSTTYADEGTEAHDWACKVLRGETTLEDLPEVFQHHLSGYVHFCRAMMDGATKTLVEEQVPLFYRLEDEGTVDCAAIHEGRIEAVDLKYGAGVEVEAEENDQATIYTLSMIRQLEEAGRIFPDDFPVLIHIYQPRHHSFTGEPKTWETTVRELKDIGIDIEADYRVAKGVGKKTLKPTQKGCQFCPIKGICKARVFDAVDPLVDFQVEGGPVLNPDAPDFLTPEQFAFIAANGKHIKKVVDDVFEMAQQRLLAGQPVAGLKLVEGKLGNRSWVDEEAAATFLRPHLSAEERYQPRKLITAPQALAKLKPKLNDLSTVAKAKLGLLPPDAASKSKTAPLIHRPEAKPLLVPEDDPRPAINITTPEDDFSDETGSAENLLGDLL